MMMAVRCHLMLIVLTALQCIAEVTMDSGPAPLLSVVPLKNDQGDSGDDLLESHRYQLFRPSPPPSDRSLSLLNLSPHVWFLASANHDDDDEDDDTCANDTRRVYDGIRQLQPWALEMWDASAKIPSRVIKGNLNWWGSYSECVNVNVPPPPLSTGSAITKSPESQPFLGQYCTVTFTFIYNTTSSTSNDEDQASDVIIRDLLDAMAVASNSGQKVLDLMVGLCVPSSCSPPDVKSNVENAFRHIPTRKAITMTASAQGCQTKDSIKLDTAAIVVLAIFGVFALMIVMSTAYEVVDVMVRRHRMAAQLLHESRDVLAASSTEIRGENSERQRSGCHRSLLLAFSALTNARQLLAVAPKKSGNLEVLNGMRFLSMAWVVMVHSYSLAIYSGGLWDNVSEILNAVRLVAFQAIIRGAIGVDTFLFMSGLLLVYSGLKKVRDSNNVWRCLGYLYLHRIIRTAPAYYMTAAWVAGPSDYVAGGGPLWPQIVQAKHDCHLTWWKTLLYIANFGDTSHMCAPHTWYMAIDLQFYIVGCILLIILRRFRNTGLILIALCGIASCVTAAVISYLEHIPSSALLLNVPVSQLFAYSVDYYIKPYCRMGPYAVGMLSGYLILNGGEFKTRIKPIVAYGLWIVTAVVCLSVVYGTYGEFTSVEQPDVLTGTMYNSLAGTAWSVGCAWIVYASHIGYGGYIKSFLSLNVWVPLARITYSAYLVHYIVIYTFYESRQDEKFHCDAFLMVTLFLGFLTLSNGIAFVFALAFELPFVKLEQALTTIKKKPVIIPVGGDRNFNTLDA